MKPATPDRPESPARGFLVSSKATARGQQFKAVHIESGVNALSYVSASDAIELCLSALTMKNKKAPKLF
jgi:hypothetical protein